MTQTDERIKLSIAEVKRRLPVGAECTIEFTGRNAKIAKANMVKTRRRITKQTSEMGSIVITPGENEGRDAYLVWKHTLAFSTSNGDILLADKLANGEPGEFFVRITEITDQKSQ